MDLFEKESHNDRYSSEESNEYEFPPSIPGILASKANISDQSSEDNSYYTSVMGNRKFTASNHPRKMHIIVDQSPIRDIDDSSITEKPSNEKVKFIK
jgi:muramidase (phage lysozyme)